VNPAWLPSGRLPTENPTDWLMTPVGRIETESSETERERGSFRSPVSNLIHTNPVVDEIPILIILQKWGITDKQVDSQSVSQSVN